jgi:uncharacterized RDD family membrane protein YckC
MRLMDTSQTTLLRIAAFLVDALSMSVVLILPSAILSYIFASVENQQGVLVVWLAAVAILSIGLLIRDGYRGRSLGKQLLGLRLMTPRGEGCGWVRSVARNLPLLIPGWNLLEVGLVFAGKARTGDKIARTVVMEE